MKRLKLKFNAPVVLSFSFLCLIVTILGIVSNGVLTNALFMTYHSSLLNPLTYLRFFTHVLGHNGWSHFLGNASYLLLLGPILEEKYGHKAILEVIIITAVVTATVNYIFFWNVGLSGASGIVFAFIMMASFTSFNEKEIPITFILVAFIFIGQQIYEGIFVRDDISNLAHILGGLVGAVVGYRLNKHSKYGY